MERKDFLKKMGWGLLAIPALHSCATVHYTDNVEDCKLTDRDDLGPFFVKGTEKVLNLNTLNLPGSPMLVRGKVFSGEGTANPIAKTKIEIWHCDDEGAYHPGGSGDVNDYKTEEITLRGYVITDASGAFAFKSIVPGLYGRRARHIHYKITAPKHQNLTTQSYFKGDQRIAADMLSQNAGECRIVEFKTDEEGSLAGVMNFHLKK